MNRILCCIVAFVMCGLFCFVSPALSAEKVDINTATVAQLTALPGIGPVIAAKIVEHRTAHPFTTIEQIKDVKGIGEAKFAAIKDQITVAPSAVPAAAPSPTPAAAVKSDAPKVETPKVEVPVKKQ